MFIPGLGFSSGSANPYIPAYLKGDAEWQYDSQLATKTIANAIEQTSDKRTFIPSDLVTLVVEYLRSHREPLTKNIFVFDPKAWSQYWTMVPPPTSFLPSDIEKIINSTKKKCMLIYIPKTIKNDVPLCFNQMVKLAAHPLGGFATAFGGLSTERYSKLYGDITVERDHWILITEEYNKVFNTGSEIRDYYDGTNLELAPGWEQASLLYTAIAIFARRVFNEENLFTDRYIGVREKITDTNKCGCEFFRPLESSNILCTFRVSSMAANMSLYHTGIGYAAVKKL